MARKPNGNDRAYKEWAPSVNRYNKKIKKASTILFITKC